MRRFLLSFFSCPQKSYYYKGNCFQEGECFMFQTVMICLALALVLLIIFMCVDTKEKTINIGKKKIPYGKENRKKKSENKKRHPKVPLFRLHLRLKSKLLKNNCATRSLYMQCITLIGLLSGKYLTDILSAIHHLF